MKVEYICFTGLNGYGIAASNYIKALDKYDVTIHPLDLLGSIHETWGYEKYKQDDDPERIQIYHCIPTVERRRGDRNQKTIGFGTFETYVPPNYWIDILNKHDAVIVPSQFCAQEFEKAGLTAPIHYIPHCIDMNEFHINVTPKTVYDKFTFLFVGSWKRRKGYDILLQAWREEFSPDEPIQLIIKTLRHHLGRAKSYCEKIKDAAPFWLVDKNFSEQELPSFLKSAHCIVLPTRGEGFGLTGLQGLALGIPVITVAHTGCTEYTDHEGCISLAPESYSYEDMDGIRQFAHTKWGSISVKTLRKYMRDVYENYSQYSSKAISDRDLLSKFDISSARDPLDRLLKC